MNISKKKKKLLLHCRPRVTVQLGPRLHLNHSLSLSLSLSYIYIYIYIRGVHGSVWVGFMPNLQPTRLHREDSWTTCRWLQTTLGWVGSVSLGTELQPPNLCRIEAQNHHIKPKVVQKSLDLSKNWSKNHHIKPKFKQNLHLTAESKQENLYLHLI